MVSLVGGRELEETVPATYQALLASNCVHSILDDLLEGFSAQVILDECEADQRAAVLALVAKVDGLRWAFPSKRTVLLVECADGQVVFELPALTVSEPDDTAPRQHPAVSPLQSSRDASTEALVSATPAQLARGAKRTADAAKAMADCSADPTSAPTAALNRGRARRADKEPLADHDNAHTAERTRRGGARRGRAVPMNSLAPP